MMMIMFVLMHSISEYLSVQGTKDDSVLAASRLAAAESSCIQRSSLQGRVMGPE